MSLLRQENIFTVIIAILQLNDHLRYCNQMSIGDYLKAKRKVT